jgi:hypothetical protein
MKPSPPRPDIKKEFQRLLECVMQFLVKVDQPLVMISQVPRSGGTLLSQLFDGHPELHAHPHELYIGYPRKEDWPVLRLDEGPARWFEKLYEPPSWAAFYQGYSKQPKQIQADRDVFPFLLVPSLHQAVFHACVKKYPPSSPREILNHYFTSYFNAWLDNRHRTSRPQKKYVTAFVPRLIMNSANIDRFLGDYPDGKIISIVRDPRSWYVSFRVHKQYKKSRYQGLDNALSQWISSTTSALTLLARHRERARVIWFDDLVRRTEAVMRDLASWLGISFHECLMVPTFNGEPIKPNSSFEIVHRGVVEEPVTRWRAILTPEEISIIEARTRGILDQALTAIAAPLQPQAA